MATQRQIKANRLNSEKSTGPTSDAGKAVSRANAVKHGLAGAGVVVPEEQARLIEQRSAEWRESFRPATALDNWQFDQMVINSVRIDHCHRKELELRAIEARRASLCWENDRRVATEELAARIGRAPSRISRRLSQSRQGCEWLLERWRLLGEILRNAGAWDDTQFSMALDLLGVDPALREHAEFEPPVKLVASEIDRLEHLLSGALQTLDEIERDAAELGIEARPSADLARLRRYESTCARRFESARERLATFAPPTPSGEPATVSPICCPVSSSPAVEASRTAMTDENWRLYESRILRQALAQRAEKDVATIQVAATPNPTPEAAKTTAHSPSLPSANFSTARASNRKKRRGNETKPITRALRAT